jgi:hypothetical protein
MSIRSRVRSVLAPFAATFAGVGGIAFHVAHGPEHILCMSIAAALAVGGALWGIYNRFLRVRRGDVGWHLAERCDKEAGHDA